jgi:hypothetical protein
VLRRRVEEVGGEAAVELGARTSGVVAATRGRGDSGKRGFDESEEGAGGAVGKVAVARGFAEGAAVVGEDGEGQVPGMGGCVGSAAGGELIGRGEEGADGGLGGPDDELSESEVVAACDFDEGLVGLEQVLEKGGGVDGFVVDLVVDGLGEVFVGG